MDGGRECQIVIDIIIIIVFFVLGNVRGWNATDLIVRIVCLEPGPKFMALLSGCVEVFSMGGGYVNANNIESRENGFSGDDIGIDDWRDD